jgi:hypothetical protein
MVPWVQFSCHIVLTLDLFMHTKSGMEVRAKLEKGGDTVDSERKRKEAFAKVGVTEVSC